MSVSPRTAAWLDAWSRCIVACDFDGGRRLFCEDVVAFGTLEDAMYGLDELVDRQWSKVWPVTRGFRFEPEGLDETASLDGALVVVTGRWSSEGRGAAGRFYARSGRATLILRAQPEGALKAIHSHLSMARGDAVRSAPSV